MPAGKSSRFLSGPASRWANVNDAAAVWLTPLASRMAVLPTAMLSDCAVGVDAVGVSMAALAQRWTDAIASVQISHVRLAI